MEQKPKTVIAIDIGFCSKCPDHKWGFYLNKQPRKKNSSNWVWFCLFYVILNVMHYLNWLVWHILSTLTTDKSYGIAGSSTRYLLEKETESKWYTRKFQHFLRSRFRGGETTKLDKTVISSNIFYVEGSGAVLFAFFTFCCAIELFGRHCVDWIKLIEAKRRIERTQ